MALVLVVIGLVVMLFVHFWLGLALVIVGLVLWLAVPAVPYGYGSWRGRGGPPP